VRLANEKGRKRASTRSAYRQALAGYGCVNPDVVVLDADISSSIQTHYFATRFPHRFFSIGVAETGLVDGPLGLALRGRVSFASTFACLMALHAGEQVRS